ncbi:MAG: hypothetical protein JWN15_4255 [Firmicutes bacterium]|nr:hypothetical protein [Bacillota bacterium]
MTSIFRWIDGLAGAFIDAKIAIFAHAANQCRNILRRVTMTHGIPIKTMRLRRGLTLPGFALLATSTGDHRQRDDGRGSEADRAGCACRSRSGGFMVVGGEEPVAECEAASEPNWSGASEKGLSFHFQSLRQNSLTSASSMACRSTGRHATCYDNAAALSAKQSTVDA